MLTVTELDVTDPSDLRDAYRVVVDVAMNDTPDEPEDDFSTFAGQLAIQWEGARRVRYVARLDGEPAGFAALRLSTGQNRGVATVIALMVRPGMRRRDVGRSIFGALRERAIAEDCTAVIGSTEVGMPGGVPRPTGGEEFASAMGGIEAMRATSSRLTLTDATLPATLSDALDTARASSTGYSLTMWRDRTPDEYAADVAALYSRNIGDQPTGTLGLVSEHYDVTRLRALEQSLLDHGYRSYCAAARHDSTGRTVGVTEIAVRGPLARQGTTIVDPAHRGHKLGLLIKAANARQTRAAEPDTRQVSTENNRENRYILAINRAIGYRPHCVEVMYRIEFTGE